MIELPDRLTAAIEAIEKGEQVDWRKLANLQALDMARLGRQFVSEAVAAQDAADKEMRDYVLAQL